MTPVEAFTVGFLLKCAEDGLTPAQAEQRMERFTKQAADPGFMSRIVGAVTSAPGKLLGAGKAVANTGLTGLNYGLKGLTLAGLAGGGAGVLGGYTLAQLNDDSISPDEVKNEELISEYRRAIQDLARRNQLGLT